MSIELSPQNEQFLTSMVAGGLFPSKEAALDAAIEALREKTQQPATLRAEHIELIEQGLASLQAGRSRDFTAADWETLRQLARDTAASTEPGGR